MNRSNAPTNELEIAFWGLRRSGNHAVIAWIVSLFEGPVGYFNDLNHSAPTTSDTCSSPLPGFDESKQAGAGTLPKRLCLCSFEDANLDSDSRPIPPTQLFGNSSRRLNIILLRDPYNMLASRLRIFRDRADTPLSREMLVHQGTPIMDLWTRYAIEFLGRSNHFDGETLPINYNRWVFDQNYRRDICEMLGGEYSEETLPFVPRNGFGSSFENSGQARLLNRIGLLHRWRHYKDDPVFRELTGKPEIHELSDEIFGEILPCETMKASAS